MFTLATYSEPTDIVILTVQCTHLSPWNITPLVWITDDFCGFTLKFGSQEHDIASAGYISAMSLEMFEEVIRSNVLGESEEPIGEEILTYDMDEDPRSIMILPNFQGSIIGDGKHLDKKGNYIGDGDDFVLYLPDNTQIRSYKETVEYIKECMS